MRMILPSDCNARLRTLRVDRKQNVSLLQPLCTYYNKGSHMLSIVDAWECMQYFFQSCFAIATTGNCSVSLTRMHWHPVPQQIKQSYTRATIHWYTTSTRRGNIFPDKVFAKSLDDGFFDSHRWCRYTPPVSTKHFPLRNRFYASLIFINNIETSKGLAMINGAIMPLQLTVKPSYNTLASTIALMVHPYQAWLPHHLMI
jgi:hypothetical protein